MIVQLGFFGACLLAVVPGARQEGVIGQSQPADAEPLPFLAATVVGDRDGNVYLNGEWRVPAGSFAPKRLSKGLSHPLLSDGADIYAYHRNDGGLWIVRATADGLVEDRRLAGLPKFEWALRLAVAPAGCNRGFAARAKFVAMDRKGRQVVGFTADGKPLGVLVDLSGFEPPKNSPLDCVGFFAETGEILVGTGYPERRTHRFAANGKEVVNGTWPYAAEAHDYPFANGRTWAVAGRVLEITSNAATRRTVGAGNLDGYRSIAWTGKGYWVGTTRGAEYYDAADPSTPVCRLGGTGAVTSLALLDGRIFATVGSRICMYWLDDRPDEPMSSDDFQLWHLGGYREGTVTGVAKRDGKLVYGFRPKSGGPAETWVFDYRISDWTHRENRLHKVNEPPPTAMAPGVASENGWTVSYSPERQAIVRKKEVSK